MSFTYQSRVRVQHCDPAGGVFYPRYFEMMTVCTEEWLSAVLGLSLDEMQTKHRLGTPTVHLDVSFKASAKLGDILDWKVIPKRIGRSSCVLFYEVSSNGLSRVSFLQTIALVDMDRKTSIPWPDHLRAKIEAQMSEKR